MGVYGNTILATSAIQNYFPLGEQSGSYIDAAGSGSLGTPNGGITRGGPSIITGEGVLSPQFDGTNVATIDLSFSVQPFITGIPWTVECVFNSIPFTPGFGSLGFSTLFGFNSNWRLLKTSDDTSLLDQYGPFSTYGTSFTGLDLSGLHHLAYVVHADGTRDIYLDGVSLGNGGNFSSGPFLAHLGGYENSPITNYPFEGQQGHIGAYVRDLTPAEIVSHSDMVKNGVPPIIVQPQLLVPSRPLASRFM